MNPEAQPAPAATRDPKVSESGGNSTALDQWRGLALVFVLISHGFYFTNRTGGIGRVGVNLFFFISGVLVFRSLAKPKETDGWTLAMGFWKRRLRRLYPALLMFVLAMIPVVFLLRNDPYAANNDPQGFLRGAPLALLYIINYFDGFPISLGHLWSVSCEMQFYLLAPVIFLLGGKSTARRYLVWGVLLAALVVMGFVGPIIDKGAHLKYHFEIAVWPMMLGFCCEYRKAWFQPLAVKWYACVLGVSVVAFGLLIALMLYGMEMKKPVVAIGSLAFLPCFLGYLRGQPWGGVCGRALTWLGERTYSIYLWQQPFTICYYLPAFLHPVGACAATLLGGVWFRFFEQPFLSSSRKEFVEKGARE